MYAEYAAEYVRHHVVVNDCDAVVARQTYKIAVSAHVTLRAAQRPACCILLLSRVVWCPVRAGGAGQLHRRKLFGATGVQCNP